LRRRRTGNEPYTKDEDFLKEIGFDQKLGAQLPLDVAFQDETGKTVRLGEYFGQKPVILLITYYNCTMLCPLLLDGLVRTLRPITFDIGKQFAVLTVSINPETLPSPSCKELRPALWPTRCGTRMAFSHRQGRRHRRSDAGDRLSIRVRQEEG
jgi:hypothetical protein